MKGMQLQCL